MSVATKRTAKYGGSDAQFSTVASPGAALTALFNLLDSALTTAGWTAITSPGSPGPNTYSSTGESGNEKLYLVMYTGAMGTGTGVEVSGGSYLTLAPCQFINGSGTRYSQLGDALLLSASGVHATAACIELDPSKTWDYAFVCDKDGYGLYLYPTTGTPTQGYWMCAGLTQRISNAKATTTTSSSITTGPSTSVTVNTTADMTATGYGIGDVIEVVALNAPGSGIYADRFSARITGITSSSVTMDSVPTLSATISSGALIGEDPQPFFATRRNSPSGSAYGAGQLSVGSSTGVAASPVVAATIGVNNNWKSQISTNGVVGDIEVPANNTAGFHSAGPMSMSRSAQGVSIAGFTTSPYREFRTSATGWRLEPMHLFGYTGATVASGKAYRGFWKYIFTNLDNGAGQSVPTYLLGLSDHNSEYVLVQSQSTGDLFLGPFPKVNATTAGPWGNPMTADERKTVEVIILENQAGQASADEAAFAENDYFGPLMQQAIDEGLVVAPQGLQLLEGTGGTVSGDDDQPTFTDRPYANDPGAPVAPVISGVSPTVGSTILNSAGINVTVSTAIGTLAECLIYAKEGPSARWELVADQNTFGPAFSTSILVSGTSTLKTYTITKDGGWRDATISLMVIASVDNSGSISQALAYTVSNPVIIYTPGHSNLNVGLN